MPNPLETFKTNESSSNASTNFDVDLRSEQPPGGGEGQKSSGPALPKVEIVNQEDKPVCHGPVCFGDSRYVPVYSTAAYADALFDTFDTDNDNHVTKAELDAYEKKFAKSIDAQEKARLDEFRSSIDSWQNLSNDRWGPETQGVTWKDISAVKSAERNAEMAERMNVLVDKHFGDIDKDRDGKLTAGEINNFKENTRLERPVTDYNALEQLAGAAKTGPLKGAFSPLAWMNPFRSSGITREDARVAAEVVKAGILWERD